MSSDRHSVPVSLPPELVNELDSLVEAGVFSSRSDALRYGARLVIRERRLARLHERTDEDAREDVRERMERKRVSWHRRVLADLKVDDWLASNVDVDAVEVPKTTVATGIEIQYVMEDAWSRERLATVHDEVADLGIELVSLSPEVMDAAADLRAAYEAVNVFDAVHLGTARTLEEPIVSTDTLFPDVDEVEHVDPREL